MLPYIKRLDKVSSLLTTAYPNAGLPNEFGEYDQTPEEMVVELEPFVAGGHLNILGGCCGSTPAHIAALRELADRYPPRKSNNSGLAA
jgi:5-methyltetrahydrofolate--homocysteine methyltransferase